MFQGRKAGDLTKKPTKSMVIFHKRKYGISPRIYGDLTIKLWRFLPLACWVSTCDITDGKTGTWIPGPQLHFWGAKLGQFVLIPI
jgi:hypothetical protein